MNSPLLRALPWLAVGLWGCSDDPELVIAVEHPTLVEVSPSAFLGTVPCLAGQGSMTRYVATLIDTTDPAQPFVLPSSPPIPCNATVGFSFVVPGHTYAATIDGYDRDDLEPVAPGVRELVDPETQELVEPRWTTECGRRPSEQVIAVQNLERGVTNCAPLEDRRPAGEVGGARIETASVLGGLRCGEKHGEVSRVEARVGEQLVGGECGDRLELSGLSSTTASLIELSAFEKGASTPRWGALCTARPVAGVTALADCSLFTERGAVDVDLPGLLDAAGLSCDEVAELRITAPDDTVRRVLPPGCTRPFRVSDLPPGEVTLDVEALPADGAERETFRCSAVVTPGLVARSVCQADD